MENVAEFLEYTKINNHIIKLEENKQTSFGLIYNLELIELETLMTYIKAKFANSFICLFKYLAKTSIFFN